MNKGVFALLLLTVLLLPMYAGLRRIRNVPRHRPEAPDSEACDLAQSEVERPIERSMDRRR
jgi:hypothetical protein